MAAWQVSEPVNSATPPITSRIPGAQLDRIALLKSNSAESSARVRAMRVGIGSRSSPSLHNRLGCGLGGWLGLDKRRLLGLQNDLIEESSAVAQLECRGQDVRAIFIDLIVLQLKAV